MKPKNVAIVSEWLTWRGGGESVLDALLETFPNAALFTTVYNEKKLPEYKPYRPQTSYLQKIPIVRDRHQALPPLLLSAIKNLDLSGHDLIISLSSAIGKGINKPKGSTHVCYCHAPMRYVWQPEIDNRLISKPFGRLFLNYLKGWDLKTNKGVDHFITNSKTVQARIKRFYGRNATVIYPPVSLIDTSKKIKKEDFFLTLGRLIPYKKIDLAILACKEKNIKLLVAGDGPEKDHLTSMANENIEFVGRVSDKEKEELLRKAKALIFPGEEDFGIVPIEALSAGTPVIAYGKGGATEYVKDGRNGILFKEQSLESLSKAIDQFNDKKFDKGYIIKSALKFSKDRFKSEIKEFIERI